MQVLTDDSRAHLRLLGRIIAVDVVTNNQERFSFVLGGARD
jgi:hypothetical protein